MKAGDYVSFRERGSDRLGILVKITPQYCLIESSGKYILRTRKGFHLI